MPHVRGANLLVTMGWGPVSGGKKLQPGKGRLLGLYNFEEYCEFGKTVHSIDAKHNFQIS